MWEAVEEDDARLVDFLVQHHIDPEVCESGRTTTPLMDAHILGRKDILKVMSLHKNEENVVLTHQLIVYVYKVCLTGCILQQ